jgi:hypothetical protein
MLGRPVTGHLGLADPLTLNGDVKRKRGRPRTLDGPQDDNACFGPRIASVQGATSLPSSSLLSQSLSIASGLAGGQALGFGAAAKLAKASLTTQAMSPLQAALNRPLDSKVATPSPPVSAPSTPPLSTTPIKMEQYESSFRASTAPEINIPFVSSLTPEQVASWGIIKMNDYLVSGTRQQYWEEYFVKHVMSVGIALVKCIYMDDTVTGANVSTLQNL